MCATTAPARRRGKANSSISSSRPRRDRYGIREKSALAGSAAATPRADAGVVGRRIALRARRRRGLQWHTAQTERAKAESALNAAA